MDPHSCTESPDDGLGWSQAEQVLRVLAGCVETQSVVDTLENTAEFVRRLAPQGISLGLHAISSAGRVVVSASAERPDPNRHSLLTMECSGDRIRIETRHPGRDPVSSDYPLTLGLEPVLEEMNRLAQTRSWQDPHRRNH
jgi:hypothetical protein